jgi:radical SAM superfamily enzyme YgiQ (UPF0313 family)
LRDQHGVRSFAILDDNFILDNRYAKNFLKTLIESQLGMTWSFSGGVRLDRLDIELVKLMERSGCTLVYVSVESGSQITLDAMKRDCELETLIEKVNLIEKHSKMTTIAFFIIGYPGETVEDIEKTIRVARALPVDRASFFFFVPLPGTAIWEDLVKDGGLRVNAEDWSHYMVHKKNISLQEIPDWRLELLKWKAYITFYGRPTIIGKILKDIRSPYQFYRYVQRGLQVLFNR